jgi:hypothetical protein
VTVPLDALRYAGSLGRSLCLAGADRGRSCSRVLTGPLLPCPERARRCCRSRDRRPPPASRQTSHRAATASSTRKRASQPAQRARPKT